MSGAYRHRLGNLNDIGTNVRRVTDFVTSPQLLTFREALDRSRQRPRARLPEYRWYAADDTFGVRRIGAPDSQVG